MKNKIGLGILVIVVVLAVYGTIQLVPIISLLRKVDVSDLSSFLLEESKNVNDLIDSSSENFSANKDNSKADLSLQSNVFEENKDSIKSDTEEPITEKPETERLNTSSINNPKKSGTTTNKNNEAIVLSSNRINSIEKEISLSDKAKAVKLILSKFSISDIKTLTDLAAEGLTQEEIAVAMQIAYSKCSEEELELIKELYNMYIGK